MNRRLLFLLALVIVIGGVVAAVLFSQNRPPATPNAGTPGTSGPVAQVGGTTVAVAPTYTPLPTVDIVVAIQQINRGQEIRPDMVDYRSWPEIYAPVSAIVDLETVIGKIARTDIYREFPITSALITENLSGLGAVGGDAAAVLPLGTRMIAVPIDRLTSGAYAIQPGDRVDVIISLLYVDIDEEFQSILPNNIRLISPNADGGFSILTEIDGRPDIIPLAPIGNFASLLTPKEDPRPRLTTQMTIQNALVVYLGDFPTDGRIFRIGGVTPVPVPAESAPTEAPSNNRASGTAVPTAVPQRPDILSLAVTPQEAVTLAYLIEAKVPITFALRPANETGSESTRQVTLEFIMSEYGIELPVRRPYAIEPAIRSIRQLIAGETIQLRPEAAPAGSNADEGN